MVIETILLGVTLYLLSVLGIGHSWLMVALAITVPLFLSVIRLVLHGEAPFVPTKKNVLETMMKLAGIRTGDHVYDLGCGDGRLLIAAAEKGAIATGYERSTLPFLLAKFRTRKHPTITVFFKDFWQRDYRDADVIFCYLLLHKMAEFEEQIWPHLKKGCRVVSNAFAMPTIKPAQQEGSTRLYIKD